ncbi:MAG: hypothetical protein ABI859_07020 [Pseudomonadota bacterium]
MKLGWLLRGSLFCLAVLVGTAVAKYRLIEPTAVATFCDKTGGTWYCYIRQGLVLMFAPQNVAGMASVVTGVWSTITRSRGLAFAALAFGGIGMLLYHFDSAVIGVLLGLLVLAREAAGGIEDAPRGGQA